MKLSIVTFVAGATTATIALRVGFVFPARLMMVFTFEWPNNIRLRLTVIGPA